MPQSAPMQWLLCFSLFMIFYQVVVSKVWHWSVRPEFIFPAPVSIVAGWWSWGV